MTKSPENAIRQLISYCGLNFETDCLTFYRSKRAVLTPSVNQVENRLITTLLTHGKVMKNR
jgi:hypothetical protein